MKIRKADKMASGAALQSPKLILELLHQAYYDRLLYFAWTLMHDNEVSKDLVQEAFVTYWNQRDEIVMDEVKVRNFLYVAVKNACLKHLRHHKVVNRYMESQNPDPVEEAVALEHMIKAEVLGEIYAAIELLPEGKQGDFKNGLSRRLKKPGNCGKTRYICEYGKDPEAAGIAVAASEIETGKFPDPDRFIFNE